MCMQIERINLKREGEQGKEEGEEELKMENSNIDNYFPFINQHCVQ